MELPRATFRARGTNHKCSLIPIAHLVLFMIQTLCSKGFHKGFDKLTLLRSLVTRFWGTYGESCSVDIQQEHERTCAIQYKGKTLSAP